MVVGINPVMDFPYSWVNTRCANNGRIYTIPIPMAAIGSKQNVFGLLNIVCQQPLINAHPPLQKR